ncbi:hypothetical protein C8Q78DRAFT_1013810 [Trametes maxima]|nr:hypothetical protein C8Q78DRAFT_1013810 [Trametes maxima]
MSIGLRARPAARSCARCDDATMHDADAAVDAYASDAYASRLHGNLSESHPESHTGGRPWQHLAQALVWTSGLAINWSPRAHYNNASRNKAGTPNRSASSFSAPGPCAGRRQLHTRPLKLGDKCIIATHILLNGARAPSSESLAPARRKGVLIPREAGASMMRRHRKRRRSVWPVRTSPAREPPRARAPIAPFRARRRQRSGAASQGQPLVRLRGSGSRSAGVCPGAGESSFRVLPLGACLVPPSLHVPLCWLPWAIISGWLRWDAVTSCWPAQGLGLSAFRAPC